jgi:hypothetical protein
MGFGNFVKLGSVYLGCIFWCLWEKKENMR